VPRPGEDASLVAGIAGSSRTTASTSRRTTQPRGSLTRRRIRRKLAEFDETRLEESEPVDKDPAVDLGALTAFGRQLVNGPRFDSARSKLGDGPPQALIEEVILDVLVDLEAAFLRAARDSSPASRAGLRKELGQRATLWLTEHVG
jgi:hypothetical protein